ncbi:Msn1p KNAG_0A01430 [Huiozyma naganishii CBS 8797]|uniref:Transcription activator GCR1-like domain-containing protein n=1 Tax=Huiozyma naganishii (strain ATCC MYA-139 / BCRC 22969 / CBS 8797 / KCTC 17520 / NBRC 10181 / NCYC 3082 / Yp74L-3) TaxID=1071383 RepID=J7RT10_HUIN7|nr:hypothetical protein KNAG_0A01430 [Kazachstania naganishii CBS 8797]CCK67832.1 hypothetical protein KNAG_0A01430 [Kazachstania naganishii CBS 8797]
MDDSVHKTRKEMLMREMSNVESMADDGDRVAGGGSVSGPGHGDGGVAGAAEGSFLDGRVGELERRIAMFETMFHALSAKLDHNFKKYDMVVNSQQQQINELNSMISVMLNDQARHGEILRDKLSSSVHGITATTSLINGIHLNLPSDTTPTASTVGTNTAIVPQQQQGSGNQGLNMRGGMFNQSSSDPFFDDILNSSTNNNNNNAGTRQDGAMRMVGGAVKPTFIRETFNSNGRVLQQPQVNAGPFQNAAMSYDQQQQQHAMPQQPLVQTAGGSVVDTGSENHRQSSISRRASPRHDQTIFETGDQSPPGNSHAAAAASAGTQRMISKEFQFIKSPHTVREVWLEYTEGVSGQPSLREMENRYQTSWRRDPAVTKHYARRKVLCKAIEKGLSRGYTLEYIIDLLENYRIVDHDKGIKQPIGWLCHPGNIPELLR